MKRHSFFKKLSALLLLLPAFLAGSSNGQTVSPVSSQTFLQAPYLYNINHWPRMADDRLQLRLRLLDTRVDQASLLLRMRMVCESLSLENPMPLPIPVSLSGGEEIQLNAHDLHAYFLPSNLVYGGNGQQAFLQSGGMLPDGVYRLYFEVYEAKSGNKVSIQESPAIFKLVAGEPPLINTPHYGSTQYYGKQNAIRFQWTPRHLHVAGFFLTEYTFEIAEIPEGAENWKEYFHTLPLIHRTATSQAFFDYGPEHPQLIPGKRYAFRVHARCSNAENEELYIKNNGYSEVFLLYYEENCPIVPQLRITNIRATTATLEWSEPVEAKSYTLLYRKNGKPDARWFKLKEELPAGTSMAKLTELEPATGYECKLTVQCDYSQSENDAVYRFTTLASDNAGLKCGKHESKESEPKNPTPLKQLHRFDQVRTSNGFIFEIEEAEGKDGIFSGSGYTHIPLLANTGVRVKFKNIFVNKDYELVSGVFTAEKDKNGL